MEDLMQPTFQYDVIPQDTITQMNTEQIEQSFELLLQSQCGIIYLLGGTCTVRMQMCLVVFECIGKHQSQVRNELTELGVPRSIAIDGICYLGDSGDGSIELVLDG